MARKLPLPGSKPWHDTVSCQGCVCVCVCVSEEAQPGGEGAEQGSEGASRGAPTHLLGSHHDVFQVSVCDANELLLNGQAGADHLQQARGARRGVHSLWGGAGGGGLWVWCTLTWVDSFLALVMASMIISLLPGTVTRTEPT